MATKITTITPIAEVRIPVKLDRERDLVFDLNTMAIYEEKTKKFYWDTLMELFDLQQLAVDKAKAEWRAAHPDEELPKVVPYEYTDILRKLPMMDFRMLIWAACHEYDEQGNIIHPLTAVQIGRCLHPLESITMLGAILAGHVQNSPTKEEVGEAPAPPANDEAPVGAERTAEEGGGEASIELPEGAFV